MTIEETQKQIDGLQQQLQQRGQTLIKNDPQAREILGAINAFTIMLNANGEVAEKAAAVEDLIEGNAANLLEVEV